MLISETKNTRLIKEHLVDTSTPGQYTIGRDTRCKYRIGMNADALGAGISRIQATLEVSQEGEVFLIDGTPEKPSARGIYINGQKIEGKAKITDQPITLYALEDFEVVLMTARKVKETEGELYETMTGGALDHLICIQERLTHLEEKMETTIQQQADRDKSQTEAISVLSESVKNVENGLQKAIGDFKKGLKRITIYGCLAASVLTAIQLAEDAAERKYSAEFMKEIAFALVTGGIAGKLALDKKKDE